MRRSGRWVMLLLLLPFVAVLWLPFYNHMLPSIAGFPFFYVWQFIWIIVTSLLTWFIYRRWHA